MERICAPATMLSMYCFDEYGNLIATQNQAGVNLTLKARGVLRHTLWPVSLERFLVCVCVCVCVACRRISGENSKRESFRANLRANACAKQNGRLIVARNLLNVMVSRGGLEPPTR